MQATPKLARVRAPPHRGFELLVVGLEELGVLRLQPLPDCSTHVAGERERKASRVGKRGWG